VPPFLDLAVADGGRIRRIRVRARVRVRVGIGIGIGRATVVREADTDNSVIELLAAVGVSRNDTAPIELEGLFAGIEGNGHWLSQPDLFHLSDGVGGRVHVDALGPRSNDFAVVMHASAFCDGVTRRVGVVLVRHDSIVDDELPGRWQETALTAPHAVVFAKAIFIGRVRSEGTVDERLLGEADWCRVVSLGDGALEGSDGGKGPAGATVALILDRTDKAISEVIDSGRLVDCVLEATATTLSSVVVKCVVAVVGFGTSAAKQFLVLLRLEVGGPVVAEDESVGVGIMCMLAVVLRDGRVVQMVTALLTVERARIGHFLVVLGAELQELRIVGHFTALSRVSDAAEGSSGHGTNQGDESES
jgi:hypothetical protein